MANETIQEYIGSLLERSHKAQAIYAEYNQEQVDKVARIVGKVSYDNREELCRMALEETGIGTMTNKLGKMFTVLGYNWNFLRGKKSVGILERDEELGIITYAKPMGVIGCITPCTNPVATAGGNAMCALKCGNAIIIAPHPRSAKTALRHAEVMREGLRSVGAPEDLILCIEEASVEATNELIHRVDAVIATGGPGMVRAAYSCGNPSFGVGQGNVQVLIDRDYSNYEYAITTAVASRAFENGASCSGEQSVIVPVEHKEEVRELMKKAGAFFVDKETVERIRDIIFPNGGPINRELPGHDAYSICKIMGIEGCPEDAKVLAFDLDSKGAEDVLNREIVAPVMRLHTYETLEEGIEIGLANLLLEGAGHTACFYSDNQENVEKVGGKWPVSRLLINQRGNNAAGNNNVNGLWPTISLGCGTWGHNSISENLNYMHLMNKTRVSFPLDKEPLTEEELWAE